MKAEEVERRERRRKSEWVKAAAPSSVAKTTQGFDGWSPCLPFTPAGGSPARDFGRERGRGGGAGGRPGGYVYR